MRRGERKVVWLCPIIQVLRICTLISTAHTMVADAHTNEHLIITVIHN